MITARSAVEREPEPRLSIFSVEPELVGSNRSGKQRLLPDQAEDSGAVNIPAELLPDQAETGGKETSDISADHTASRWLSETTTDGDSNPPDRGEVHHSVVNSEQEQ